MADKKYIECGKIINTHGCQGAIKAESWCNSEKDLSMLERIFLKSSADFIEYKVLKASVFKQFVIFTLENVKDMDSAMLLKNQTIYALRKDFHLKEGEFFISDLIGLNVIDSKTHRIYGTVSEVINRGASDIYVVKTENGESMIPAVDEFIVSIDFDEGVIVSPIDGMFD